MAIVQERYYLPEDLATGIAIGIYRRCGSVVRYAKGAKRGQIVKHLKPIDSKVVEQTERFSTKALQFIQHHQKGVVLSSGLFILGMGVWSYNRWKNQEPKVFKDFRETLNIYIDAIRHGNMDVNKINSLLNALEVLKKHKDYEIISMQLTEENFEVLVGRIYDYTIKLAVDNKVSLFNDEMDIRSDAITRLQSYLKTQKRIFETVS